VNRAILLAQIALATISKSASAAVRSRQTTTTKRTSYVMMAHFNLKTIKARR
jgi:hypothetical protein